MKLTSDNETLAENKVLILYILNKIDTPVSNNELLQLVLSIEDMNYFYFQQFILDLLENKYIEEYRQEENSEPIYRLTSAGKSTLELTKDFDYFKLYFSDIGLFTTMLFDSGKGIEDNIYSKLLSDKLESDLGYLYENVVAQMIVASGRNLYYHTWRDKDKTHSNEVDFLITNKNKIIPIEVKSSNIKNHKSIDLFVEKYTQIVGRRFLFSQKDISHDGMLELMPIYLVPFILESL